MHIIQEDFLITHVTSSFKIRISVTLTFVHVSPTRWTLNGSTILSEEDPGSQDFDCKNIVCPFLYYKSSMLPHSFLPNYTHRYYTNVPISGYFKIPQKIST